MKRNLAGARRLLAGLALVVLCTPGCATTHSFYGPGHGHACDFPPWPSGPMCFGYYPTCWRPWPEECPPCPSPFVPPLEGELLKPDLIPTPTAPEERLLPPEGHVLPPAALPAQPGERSPAEPRTSSRRPSSEFLYDPRLGE